MENSHTQLAPDLGSAVVLDTSSLIADPGALLAFPNAEVVLPLTVIEELDDAKRRLDAVGYAARTALRSLERYRVTHLASHPGAGPADPISLPNGGTVRIEDNGVHRSMLRDAGLDPDKPDNRILAAAYTLAQSGPVTVCSADTAMRVKAAHLGLCAFELSATPTIDPSRLGRPVQLDVPSSLIDELHRSRLPVDELPAECLSLHQDALVSNAAVIARAGQSSSALCRVHDGALVKLRSDQSAWGLRPRSAQQRFALDVLLDPEVPVVALSGLAGTGKTILALAAALEQVFEPQSRTYDRLMILRPVVSVGRQDIGFLPGDMAEKLGPWFEAIVDTVVALSDSLSHRQAAAIIDAWVEEGLLAMSSVGFMRGRSLQSTFVILDEAQNVEPLVAKTVLTRLGQGSKAVLLGDTTQIDSPWLSEHSNALSALTSAFSGSELFAHLHLTRGERSDVATLAAELL